MAGRYRLVRGEFHLYYQGERHVGSQPDGDSVWFKPNNVNFLMDFNGRSVEPNKGGMVQLRIEAIDSLELHYKGCHQELEGAAAARAFTLDFLGFREVEFSGLAVRSAKPHPRRGYILTSAIDPYGRPVSFAFPGSTTRRDGSDGVFLSVSWLNDSLNAALAKSGHAYPAFYTGLPVTLRNRVETLCDRARSNRKGVWATDDSHREVEIRDGDHLQTKALWPKLFRRLVTYFADDNVGLGNLDAWLREDPKRDDALWLRRTEEKGNLHDIIEVNGNWLTMTEKPEDLVVEPQ